MTKNKQVFFERLKEKMAYLEGLDVFKPFTYMPTRFLLQFLLNLCFNFNANIKQ